MRFLCQHESWYRYECNYGWSHPTEYGCYPWNIHELMEEECYGKDNKEGGKHCAKACTDGARGLSEFKTYEKADVYGKDTRATLCDGDDISKLFLWNPLPFLNDFFLNYL